MAAKTSWGGNARVDGWRKPLAICLVPLAVLLAVACGDDERPRDNAAGGAAAGADGGKTSGGSTTNVGGTPGDSGSEGGSGAVGNEGGSAGASEDRGGSSGSAGSGGSGGVGVVAPEPGRPGFGMVGLGSYSASANYRLFGSVGDSPGANLKSTSPNYILHGGLVGTTQP